MSVLLVENLGKAYREYNSEWVRVARWLGLPVSPKSESWVLRGINFEIQAGEAVGIVGQNGAGKSTLLKIITGTLQQTEGRAVAAGRISAMLELGMGFQPELTGRQNAYHAAGLMGFSYQQIRDSMGAIEDFAEIGEYFDQPVRTYSSGMQARLAFAIATFSRPEILIVDEVLSVGDAYFQHKSFDRIRKFQSEGTTLLIVSHDRAAIQRLCSRTLLLENGNVIKDGGPEEVLDFYNALIAEKENSRVEVTKLGDGRAQTRSGTGEASITSVSMHDKEGNAIEFIPVGSSVQLRINVIANTELSELVVGYMIKDRLGQPVFGTNTFHLSARQQNVDAGTTLKYVFHFAANLGVGSYSIAVAAHTGDTHLEQNYEWTDHALLFNVVNTSQPIFVGLAWLPPEIEVHQ